MKCISVGALMPEIAVCLHVADALARLRSGGYEVYRPESMNEVDDLVAETGRGRQQPMMSLKRNDFTECDAFWIFLKFKGQAVAGSGVKLVDLGDEAFEAHLRRTSQNQYGRIEDPIVSIARPLNGLISGRHVYAGELEFHKDHRGKMSVLSSFVSVLFGIAFIKWPDFNCIYAYLPDHHRRIAIDYGFTTTIRNAVTWKSPVPSGRLNSHVISLVPRDQLIHWWTTSAAQSEQHEPQ